MRNPNSPFTTRSNGAATPTANEKFNISGKMGTHNYNQASSPQSRGMRRTQNDSSHKPNFRPLTSAYNGPSKGCSHDEPDYGFNGNVSYTPYDARAYNPNTILSSDPSFYEMPPNYSFSSTHTFQQTPSNQSQTNHLKHTSPMTNHKINDDRRQFSEPVSNSISAPLQDIIRRYFPNAEIIRVDPDDYDSTYDDAYPGQYYNDDDQYDYSDQYYNDDDDDDEEEEDADYAFADQYNSSFDEDFEPEPFLCSEIKALSQRVDQLSKLVESLTLHQQQASTPEELEERITANVFSTLADYFDSQESEDNSEDNSEEDFQEDSEEEDTPKDDQFDESDNSNDCSDSVTKDSISFKEILRKYFPNAIFIDLDDDDMDSEDDDAYDEAHVDRQCAEDSYVTQNPSSKEPSEEEPTYSNDLKELTKRVGELTKIVEAVTLGQQEKSSNDELEDRITANVLRTLKGYMDSHRSENNSEESLQEEWEDDDVDFNEEDSSASEQIEESDKANDCKDSTTTYDVEDHVLANLFATMEQRLTTKMIEYANKHLTTILTNYVDVLLETGLIRIQQQLLERLTDRRDQRCNPSTNCPFMDAIEKAMGEESYQRLEERVSTDVFDSVMDYIEDNFESLLSEQVIAKARDFIKREIHDQLTYKSVITGQSRKVIDSIKWSDYKNLDDYSESSSLMDKSSSLIPDHVDYKSQSPQIFFTPNGQRPVHGLGNKSPEVMNDKEDVELDPRSDEWFDKYMRQEKERFGKLKLEGGLGKGHNTDSSKNILEPEMYDESDEDAQYEVDPFDDNDDLFDDDNLLDRLNDGFQTQEKPNASACVNSSQCCSCKKRPRINCCISSRDFFDKTPAVGDDNSDQNYINAYHRSDLQRYGQPDKWNNRGYFGYDVNSRSQHMDVFHTDSNLAKQILQVGQPSEMRPEDEPVVVVPSKINGSPFVDMDNEPFNPIIAQSLEGFAYQEDEEEDGELLNEYSEFDLIPYEDIFLDDDDDYYEEDEQTFFSVFGLNTQNSRQSSLVPTYNQDYYDDENGPVEFIRPLSKYQIEVPSIEESEPNSVNENIVSNSESESNAEEPVEEKPKRKRGRPQGSKNKPKVTEDTAAEKPTPKKRGRPAKNKTVETPSTPSENTNTQTNPQ